MNGSRGLRVCSGTASLARGTSSSSHVVPAAPQVPRSEPPAAAAPALRLLPGCAAGICGESRRTFQCSRLENKERWVLVGYRNIFRFKRGRFSALRRAHPLPNSVIFSSVGLGPCLGCLVFRGDLKLQGIVLVPVDPTQRDDGHLKERRREAVWLRPAAVGGGEGWARF